jgi:hypothetical protein
LSPPSSVDYALIKPRWRLRVKGKTGDPGVNSLLLPDGDRCLTKFAAPAGADNGRQMATVSAALRRELFEAVSEMYRKGSTLEKRRIIDEFVALTGHHRKYAVRALRTVVSDGEIRGRSRSRVYGEARSHRADGPVGSVRPDLWQGHASQYWRAQDARRQLHIVFVIEPQPYPPRPGSFRKSHM